MTQVILLPHPANERLPPPGQTRCEWPAEGRPHRRKFLAVNGRWRDSDGSVASGRLYVWTEYEPPTVCLTERGPARTDGLPRVVQEVDPNYGSARRRLNTDPWIFSPGFVWTWCRHGQIRRKTILPGDVVLFGSSMDHGWYLDTVLVVGPKRMKAPIKPRKLGTGYERLVAPTLGSTVQQVQPFVGKEYMQDGRPFSFVPASSTGAVPRLEISCLLRMLEKKTGGMPSPDNRQALTFCSPTEGIDSFWSALLECVYASGRVCGVSFELPVLPESLRTAEPRGTRKVASCAPSRDTGATSDSACRGRRRSRTT